MFTAQLPVIIIAIFSLSKKGYDLVLAIKKGKSEQIKIELFFFSLILLLATALIIFNVVNANTK